MIAAPSGKRRILVFWDYRRKDQLLPFDRLADAFEWSFIFFREPAEDAVELPYPRAYWGAYKTPHSLIRHLQPEAVIFSDLSSLYAVALNAACKQLGVRTYLLEHGIKLSLDYYIRFERRRRAMERSNLQTAPTHRKTKLGKAHTLVFYFSTFLRSGRADAFTALRLFYRVFRNRTHDGYLGMHSEFRRPDRYILFSKQNYAYYRDRDGISEDRVTYFGNPYQDDFSSRSIPPHGGQAYYLLLDDGQVEVFGVTAGQKSDFIGKLNEFALARAAQLVVKLHPLDYGRTDLPQHPNIVYRQDADVASLVAGAIGCFAISTTLMLPLIPLGKVIVFRLAESKIQELIEPYGARFLDFFAFQAAEIDFDRSNLPAQKAEEFVDRFLYRNDGQALQRLKLCLAPGS